MPTAARAQPGTGERNPNPRLLNGLLYCAEHEQQQLYVGGAKAGSFFCKKCRESSAEQRPLFSLLNVKFATRKVLETIRDVLQADDALVEKVVTYCQAAAAALQMPDASHLASLRNRERQLTKSIEVTRRNPGESPEDQEEAARLVRAFQAERTQVKAEISRLETLQNYVVRIPTAIEVREELGRLDAVLHAVQGGGHEEQRSAARAVIELVTGGRIDVAQMGSACADVVGCEASLNPMWFK